jgi:predicted ATP-grasp superfamily ATP-dependent carboligase
MLRCNEPHQNSTKPRSDLCGPAYFGLPTHGPLRNSLKIDAPMMDRPRNLLVLSATASAINVIKSLQRDLDVKLFVSDVSLYASGLYQRGVTPVLLPPARALNDYRAALDSHIAKNNIEMIIPTSDRDIEAVVKLIHGGWDPPVAMFRPSLTSQQILANKLSLAKHVRSHGLPAPATWTNLDDATFPAVIKPLSEGGARGVAIVHHRRNAEEAIRRCKETFGSQCVIQEYIPGGVGSTYISLMLYDQRGELIANDVMRSSLTYFTWGGGGNAGYPTQDEDISNASQAIIAAVGGWKGPLNLEFRRHSETRQIYLIEANCRLNGYSYLTTMNGANYPRAIVDLLAGKDPSLSVCAPCPSNNFVLGFREALVDHWVGELAAL